MSLANIHERDIVRDDRSVTSVPVRRKDPDMFKFFIFLTTLFLMPPLITPNGHAETADQPADQSPQKPETQSALIVDTTELDVGRVYQGSVIEHDFTLSNPATDRTVSITQARADCGCNVSILGDQSVPPGGKTTIHFEMETQVHLGHFSKTISIQHAINDLTRWQDIIVKGEIVSVIECKPANVFFKKVMFAEEASEHVLIRTIESALLRDVRTENKRVVVTFKPVIEPGSDASTDQSESNDATKKNPTSWDLTVTIPNTTPTGKLEDTIILNLDSPNQTEARIAVKAVVRSPVSVSPTQIYLGAIDHGQEYPSRIKVTKSGDATLQAPTVKSDLAGVTWTIDEKKPGAEYDIKLLFTIPVSVSAQYTGIVMVMTTDPTLPEFEVPIFGYRVVQGTEKDIPSGK